MSGKTGCMGGAGLIAANQACQDSGPRSGQAEASGFDLALRKAAPAAGAKEDPSSKRKEAVADDSKRSTLADESTRPPDGANVVLPDVLRSILRRPVEQQLGQALPPRQDQTQAGQTKGTQQRLPPPGAGAPPKSSAFALGGRAEISLLATNNAVNQFLGPPRNANPPAGWGFASTVEGYGMWSLSSNAKLSAFVRAGFGEFPKVSSADTSNWSVGVRFEGQAANVKLFGLGLSGFGYSGEYQRLHTYRGSRLFTSHDFNAKGGVALDVSKGTKLRPSLTFGGRIPDREVMPSGNTKDFQRFVLSPGIDVEHKLKDWMWLVGSGGLSWSYFTSGSNAGRTDLNASVKAGIRFERYLTMGWQFVNRGSTVPGFGYNSSTFWITLSVERLFVK